MGKSKNTVAEGTERTGENEAVVSSSFSGFFISNGNSSTGHSVSRSLDSRFKPSSPVKRKTPYLTNKTFFGELQLSVFCILNLLCDYLNWSAKQINDDEEPANIT